MKNLKILTILLASAFLFACAGGEGGEAVEPAAPTEEVATTTDAAETVEAEGTETTDAEGTEQVTEGKCNLGRKSGGIVQTTETECADLGGKFLGE